MFTMHSTITFICVYNNISQLNFLLNRSLSNAGGGYPKLLINNINHKYSSCAEAYNRELQQHDNDLGDILVFLHQDIAFDNDDWLERIKIELQTNPNQILGFAGMSTRGRTISNLKYYHSKRFITATQLSEKTEVESLDECCFAMSKNLYNKIRFDEKTCGHWHLYAVDFCYEAYRTYRIKSYVLPESIYHKIDGTTGQTTDLHFLYTIWKITRKYHKDFSLIYTPCYIVSTNFMPCVMKIAKTLVRNIIKSMKR